MTELKLEATSARSRNKQASSFSSPGSIVIVLTLPSVQGLRSSWSSGYLLSVLLLSTIGERE